MKLTKIRVDGKKLDESMIKAIMVSMQVKMIKAGYITDFERVNSQSVSIGLHGRSFKVDVQRLGYNAQHGPFNTRLKLGYKRTCTPTWVQRVEFNDIVNSVLDSFKVSCNIKSGPFTIREGLTSFTENDWLDQVPSWMTHNESRGYYVSALPKSEV